MRTKSSIKFKEAPVKKSMFFIILLIVFVFGTGPTSFAQMASENYSIPTSVFSGGGASMSSTSYLNTATLGQSTPLADPGDPPYSTSFELFPGFWNTLEADFIISECMWDKEPTVRDDDVDGLDLDTFAYESFSESDLSFFAAEFGRDDCGE